MDAPFDHQPVALDTILELLAPQPGETFCDATIGGGGHAERVLEATAPDGRLLGIDRDLEAVDAATRRLERFGDRVVVRHGRFSDLERLMAEAGMTSLDGLVLDLGVSSHQLDAARRGFSFIHDGPLDMRMDTTSGETAAALLARTSEDDLADLVFRFGGERYSRRVARSIKRMEED